ncbi:hypothetical protein CA13_16120 [Planctomycetes bacterium CA13]|uniref:Uncharacterized protein n=1 Tax=Novipirellula herctigrandis TaxID=2527986 RepID=A0A5C5YYK7_9BACT|nr:hypothetical protein CA13_16120 [Planctomycetes bacterium CA13]
MTKITKNCFCMILLIQNYLLESRASGLALAEMIRSFSLLVGILVANATLVGFKPELHAWISHCDQSNTGT